MSNAKNPSKIDALQKKSGNGQDQRRVEFGFSDSYSAPDYKVVTLASGATSDLRKLKTSIFDTLLF